jgi:hypothetical protein
VLVVYWTDHGRRSNTHLRSAHTVTTVSIDTSLGDDAKAEAKSVCDTAAKAAYMDDINSIRVLSATGTELSQGIKGAGCL